MPTQDSVKVEESLTQKQEDSRSSQGNGSSKSSDDRPELNRVMEENRKLKEQYEKQQEQIEEMKGDWENRLEELQSKANPTKAQEAEIETLEDKIRAIEADARSKPWFEKIRRESSSVAKSELFALDKSMAIEWVSDKADELGMTFKKLEAEIMPSIQEGRWSNEPLRVRVKKAFKEYNSRVQAEKKSEDDRKKGIQRSEEGREAPGKRQPSDVVALADSGNIRGALGKIYEQQTTTRRR